MKKKGLEFERASRDIWEACRKESEEKKLCTYNPKNKNGRKEVS